MLTPVSAPWPQAWGTEPRRRRFPLEAEKAIAGFQIGATSVWSRPAAPEHTALNHAGAGDSGRSRCNRRRRQKRRINYKLGSIYAVVTALLLSVQEPFSFLAAKRLSLTQFVFLTQVALVMSIPLLMVSGKSRRDLVSLLGNAANYFKFGVLFLIGMTGLLLFKLALSNAHPIIISAIINLQPFFAALVALIITRVPIPVSPAIFFACLVSAFLGAMAVAWSQVGEANRPDFSQLAESAMHGTWLYAIPVPICSALGGTLVCKWFAKYDESAAMAANFAVSALLLIPAAGLSLVLALRIGFWPDPSGHPDDRRHDRRRLGGSRALSNRAQRHRQ